MNEYPKYVRFKKHILVRTYRNDEYWCYNGNWGITSYLRMISFDKNELVSRRTNEFPKNEVLYKATEKEWLEYVGLYLPEDYILEDGMTGKQYLKGKESIDFYSKSKSIKITRDDNGNYITQIIDNKFMYLLIR